MRQKRVLIGDDYWIENDRGEHVYKVNGKALRLCKTLIFEAARGAEPVKIQDRMLHVRDTMEIEDRDGEPGRGGKKALITPLRDRWAVKVADGPGPQVKGNLVDDEYAIEDGRTRAAEVSKKWFRVADTTAWRSLPGRTRW